MICGYELSPYRYCRRRTRSRRCYQHTQLAIDPRTLREIADRWACEERGDGDWHFHDASLSGVLRDIAACMEAAA